MLMLAGLFCQIYRSLLTLVRTSGWLWDPAVDGVLLDRARPNHIQHTPQPPRPVGSVREREREREREGARGSESESEREREREREGEREREAMREAICEQGSFAR